ncbi:FBD-associated F-box protein At5g60610-like isoform X2 [Cornus florida]|nr:FBD-associated F-box protein At5g60610-like isoform X2 [Cornus florida]XP_059648954.1 FBD-associated F-box protein At5g60610-like isoform X2 [Cornus florida]
MEDRISELSDEILENILSLLTMKEAARTSVLSHRWENLWKFFTGSLDFVIPNKSVGLKQRKVSSIIGRPRYINWVNQVLNSHRGQTIDELKICFDLEDSHDGRFFDRWINFAIEKRVRMLELDLSRQYLYSQLGYTYAFPFWLLNLPLGFSSFDTLTSLCLTCVNITGEGVAYFLSSCPLLEHLSLRLSLSLVNLKVAGTSLKLKHLEIASCTNLKDIEISAINLVSFKYFGPKISMSFQKVPLLAEVSIRGHYCDILVSEYKKPTFYLSQLEKLILELDCQNTEIYMCEGGFFPKFSNLKELEIKVWVFNDQCILLLNSLINGSPCLYRFLLEVTFRGPAPSWAKFNWEREIMHSQVRQVTESAHQCLKVVEFTRWVGLEADVELAMCLLESVVSLEKMIIDARNPSFMGGLGLGFMEDWDFQELETTNGKAAARERARQLEAKLPPHAELVIL